LFVDPTAALPRPVVLQAFKMVAGQRAQISKVRCGVQDYEALVRLLGETLKRPDKLAACKVSRSLIAIAQDHAVIWYV
jgi:hypothetical protein